jgi:polysaccharide export outer membrane protein
MFALLLKRFVLGLAFLLMGGAAMAQTTPESSETENPFIPFSTTIPVTPLSTSTSNPGPILTPGSVFLQDQGYLIGPGDVLNVDIFDVPEYSGAYGVLADGSLTLPLVGPISVSGVTLDQASEIMSRKFAAVLRRPIVTVSLVEARPVQVAIVGQIKHPGSYTVETLTTVSQVINGAGGVMPSADLEQVQLRRRLPLGQGNGLGNTQTITLNLRELVNGGDLNQDLSLRDGDEIIIPETMDLNPEQVERVALSTIADNSPAPIQIAVAGAVRRSGSYTIDDPIKRVTTAIQGAGGITQQADIRKIEVRRTNTRGERQTIAIDFWKLLKEGDLSQDLWLQNGDSIYIPTATSLSPNELTSLAASTLSPEVITVNVVGEVAGPGAIPVRPNTPLNQAILAAGGFTNRSKKGSVELVRLNPNGTVTQRTIEVDWENDLHSEHNPALQEHDTIIVGRSGFTVFRDGLGAVLSPLTAGFSIFNLLGF